VSYWDSSALLKLYAKEADSPVFEQYALQLGSPPVISRLGLHEIHTALRRKESEGVLIPGGAATIHQQLLQHALNRQITIIEFTSGVENKFRDVLEQCFKKAPPLLVRTMDAIHLASALVASETEIVVTDKRMRDCAAMLGLKLFP
jgi:predicted nucleic acid-binding protein